MTKINCWELLIVDTIVSILVALGVLDSPVCDTKMRKLNKKHISETGYY